MLDRPLQIGLTVSGAVVTVKDSSCHRGTADTVDQKAGRNPLLQCSGSDRQFEAGTDAVRQQCAVNQRLTCIFQRRFQMVGIILRKAGRGSDCTGMHIHHYDSALINLFSHLLDYLLHPLIEGEDDSLLRRSGTAFHLHGAIFHRTSQRIHLTAHRHLLSGGSKLVIVGLFNAADSISLSIQITQQMHCQLLGRIMRQTGRYGKIFHVGCINLLTILQRKDKRRSLCGSVQSQTAAGAGDLLRTCLYRIIGRQHSKIIALFGVGERL